MKKQHAVIGAAQFKAKCLGLIDEVHSRQRREVIITKRGKPVAKLVPANREIPPLYGCMKGLGSITGDIMEPLDVEWEAMTSDDISGI